MLMAGKRQKKKTIGGISYTHSHRLLVYVGIHTRNTHTYIHIRTRTHAHTYHVRVATAVQSYWFRRLPTTLRITFVIIGRCRPSVPFLIPFSRALPLSANARVRSSPTALTRRRHDRRRRHRRRAGCYVYPIKQVAPQFIILLCPSGCVSHSIMYVCCVRCWCWRVTQFDCCDGPVVAAVFVTRSEIARVKMRCTGCFDFRT